MEKIQPDIETIKKEIQILYTYDRIKRGEGWLEHHVYGVAYYKNMLSWFGFAHSPTYEHELLHQLAIHFKYRKEKV